MAEITVTYVRLTQVEASAGGGETELLNAGAVPGGDFRGTLTFSANFLDVGQQIRVHAWGQYVNNTTTAGLARIRLYLNNSAIGDTGADLDLPVSSTWCWQFWGLITVLAIGQSGSVRCSGAFGSFDPSTSRLLKMMGPSLSTIDTTENQELDMTALVTDAGSVILDQASVEWMDSPPLPP